TLTTNGSALRRLAPALADAGLQRVTVSLDSLDDAVFSAMNGVDYPVAKVLDGIAAAAEAGLGPIKINMVVRRGLNEASVLPMARCGTLSRPSGASATTATPSSGPRRRRRVCPGSRCSRWAADERNWRSRLDEVRRTTSVSPIAIG